MLLLLQTLNIVYIPFLHCALYISCYFCFRLWTKYISCLMLHLYRLPFTEIEFIWSEYFEKKRWIFSLHFKTSHVLSSSYNVSVNNSGWPEATVLICCFIPTIKEFGVRREEEKGKLQFYPRPLWAHHSICSYAHILSDRLSKGFAILPYLMRV